MKKNEFHTSKGIITGEQVDDFIIRMQKLIIKQAIKELGYDEKYCPPVTIGLINDVKYQNNLPLLVEHRHLVENDFEKMERLFSIFLNASEAFHNLEIELKIMRSKQLDIRDKNKEKK